jgi:hypothetical protein
MALSAARWFAALRAYLVVSFSNNIFQHCSPDHGIHLYVFCLKFMVDFRRKELFLFSQLKAAQFKIVILVNIFIGPSKH